jgi:hypothetical protein
MQVLAYDPYRQRRGRAPRGARKGRARRLVAARRFRLDQLSAHRRDPQNDRRARICADEAARPISSPRRAASFTTRRRSNSALRNNKIAGAGLDVWEQEPPPADHPLMKLRQRHRQRAYRWRDQGSAHQDGSIRGRADLRRTRRQAGETRFSIRKSGRITPSGLRSTFGFAPQRHRPASQNRHAAEKY